MNRTLLRMAALAGVLALAAAACGGNDTQENGGQETGAEEAAGSTDETCVDRLTSGSSLEPVEDRLEGILPTNVDVPVDLGYPRCERQLANPSQALGAFDEENEALTESGAFEPLVGAVEHRFLGEAGPTAGVDGAMRAAGFVFEDEGSARAAVRLTRPILVDAAKKIEDPLQPFMEIPAEGLGEDGFGLRGTYVPAQPDFDAVLYVWNRGDLVLSVWGWGPKGEPDSAPDEEMLEVARLMDERTS